MKPLPETFVLDVDGVLTPGTFIYSSNGKIMKFFGADDHDALKLLKQHMNIIFVTGDKSGFDISRKRIVDDMQFTLELVSTFNRVDWIESRFDLSRCVYMGDGIFDPFVMRAANYSIAPNNADSLAKETADFVTIRNGGDRAVAEACIHLMDKFFGGFNLFDPNHKKIKFSGV